MEMQFQRFLVKPDCVYPVGSLTFGAKNNGQDSGSISFTSVVSLRLWVVVDEN